MTERPKLPALDPVSLELRLTEAEAEIRNLKMMIQALERLVPAPQRALLSNWEWLPR